MVQARIEPSPAEQLRELRKARDRYAALAEKLHDSADPELNPDEKLARELDARRILRSYEKSISNSVVRMSSMDKTHRFARPSLGMRTWLVIFVAISVLEGGMLAAYFRPEIFRLLPPQKTAAKIERPAPTTSIQVTPIKAVPKPLAAPPAPAIAAPVVPPQIEVPKPTIRPSAPPPVAAATSKPAPQPAPKSIAASPLAAAPKPITPPQLVLIAPPPIDAPPMPVIVLEPPPAAQPAPIAPPPVATSPVTPSSSPATAPAAPQTPPPVATAQPASPPPVVFVAPPQQPAPRAAAFTRPEAIVETHTRPPYPNEAKRLGLGGTTRMRLAISPLGAANTCEIVKSAGSDQLDAAACSYVQRVWRWKPAIQDGQPVAANTEVTIVWNLLSAH